MRSKTIPKEEPKKGKTPEYYIGEQGVKRKRVSNRFDREEIGRRGMPNPAPGNNAKRTGQKRIARGPPDPENLQPNRKPPPKPAGRLNARKVTFTGVREVQIPAVPGANRKPPRAASVQSGAPLPPKGGNTKKKK